MTFSISNVLVPYGDSYETINVHITDDRISAIEAVEPASEPCDRLLLPGFVNAHTHSTQVWQRGLIPQLPLELWLADLIDSGTNDLEQVYWGAVSTAVDTVLSGGTCVIDHAYLVRDRELETIAALVKGYKAVGIRAVIAPLIQDLQLSSGLPMGSASSPSSTQEILAMMDAIVQQFHQPEQGIYIGVGPTGFHRCSDALLQGCAELSDRYNLCRHMHLLETRSQKLLAQERYGITAVEQLRNLGILNDRTTLAHSVWITDQDIEILAQTGSTVVHNPVSNLRLGSGIAPILKCLKAGVNVAMGCDGAASNDAQDLLEAIKLGTILHNLVDPDYRSWLTPRSTVTMAALGGAKGIGLAAQTGTIEVGKAADLVLYDLSHPSLLPRTDPLQLLILGRPTNVVHSVWINGKPIVEAGQMRTVDITSLYQAFRDHKIPRPNFQTIHQLEARYREVMQRF